MEGRQADGAAPGDGRTYLYSFFPRLSYRRTPKELGIPGLPPSNITARRGVAAGRTGRQCIQFNTC